jgi:predicted MFS family arabinose efflux permease
MIGCFAQTFPGKPVYLIAFCALRVRCILYTLSDNPIWLVAVQILDGVGAGVFGIMQTLVVADLTKATGRFNLAQGAIAMAVGYRRFLEQSSWGQGGPVGGLSSRICSMS